MQSYRQLSLGRQVIDLHQTFRAGGLDYNWRPKIAIARADATRAYLNRLPWDDCVFSPLQFYSNSAKSSVIRIPNSVFGPGPTTAQGQRVAVTGNALVPSIPPWARPRHGLHNYYILWEANWQGPPVDPALLKHIGKHIYVVLAVWDLTELERSVLSLRVAN